MKKAILGVVMALVASLIPATVSAQDMVQYSSNTGFSCLVPATASEVPADGAVAVVTPDQEFTVTAIPVEGDALNEEIITGIMKTMADAAEMDLAKAEPIDLENKTIEGTLYMQVKENGMVAAVGLVGLSEGNQAFFITLVASPNYVKAVDAVLKSMEYNGEAVKP